MLAVTAKGACYLPARLVEARYGIRNATVDRWLAVPVVGFPRQMKVRGQPPMPRSRRSASSVARTIPAAAGAGIITLSDPITDYEGISVALKRRRQQLGFSCAELEHVSGLQAGYTTKLEKFGQPYGRRFGPVSLPLWLQGLRAGLVLVEAS